MPHAGYDIPRLHRRLQRWIAAVAFVAVLGWMFQFATHLHAGGEQNHDQGAPHHVQHSCGYCAAMATGAGPVAFVVPLVRAATQTTAVAAPASQALTAVPAPYFSRGPPTA